MCNYCRNISHIPPPGVPRAPGLLHLVVLLRLVRLRRHRHRLPELLRRPAGRVRRRDLPGRTLAEAEVPSCRRGGGTVTVVDEWCNTRHTDPLE